MEVLTNYNASDIGKTACYIWKGKEFYSRIKEVNEQEQLLKIELPNGTTWVRAENITYIPF